MPTAYLVGCGYTGGRLAALHRDAGARVVGLVRSTTAAARVRALGLEPVTGDLDDPHGLPEPPAADVTYYLAPPPRSGDTDPRIAGWLQSLEAAPPGRVVYVSTSGVYGDCGGAWVTEARPPAPATDRARRRLAAERVVTTWGSARGIPVVVLRAPGIYGPGRVPVERLRQGRPVPLAEAAPYTNRIHVTDLAAACAAAASPGVPGGIYNVCDDEPLKVTEYYRRLAAACDLPPPLELPWSELEVVLTASSLSFLRESRRLDNRRMHQVLGLRLTYPDLAAGLAACPEVAESATGNGRP